MARNQLASSLPKELHQEYQRIRRATDIMLANLLQKSDISKLT